MTVEPHSEEEFYSIKLSNWGSNEVPAVVVAEAVVAAADVVVYVATAGRKYLTILGLA